MADTPTLLTAEREAELRAYDDLNAYQTCIVWSHIDAQRERIQALESSRQRVRESFGHKNDDGSCACPYCRRDADDLAEHAADYELRWFDAETHRTAAVKRAEKAESEVSALTAQRERLRTALDDILCVIIADDLIPESVSYMREARAALALSATPAKSCEWTEDADGIWHTGCGHTFFFDTDGPVENKQKFCGYCGLALSAKGATQS